MLRESREQLEAEKCSVEISKLLAEGRKLAVERKKLQRELAFYPFTMILALSSAAVAVLAFFRQ